MQEEILWLCEAAHVPVIWATQVLETLAKTGLPSRAEITDAAMGERAECVMLNKGPHDRRAPSKTLDDILRADAGAPAQEADAASASRRLAARGGARNPGARARRRQRGAAGAALREPRLLTEPESGSKNRQG